MNKSLITTIAGVILLFSDAVYPQLLTAYSNIDTTQAWNSGAGYIGTYKGNSWAWADQFTATATGQITSIDALMTVGAEGSLSGNNDVTLALFTDNAGVMASTAFWSEDFVGKLSSFSSGMVSSFAPTPVTLVANTTYWLEAFVAGTTSASYQLWYLNNTNQSGAVWSSVNRNVNYANTAPLPQQMGFQVIVDDGLLAQVPLSPSSLLFVTGFGILIIADKFKDA